MNVTSCSIGCRVCTNLLFRMMSICRIGAVPTTFTQQLETAAQLDDIALQILVAARLQTVIENDVVRGAI